MMPRVNNAATAVAVGSVVLSVIWWVLYRQGINLYLVPSAVFDGAFWQVVTWLPVSVEAMPVLFTALIIWQTGGQLETYWGRWRFLRFLFGVPLLAGGFTLLVHLLIPLQGTFLGGQVIFGSLWVASGCVSWNTTISLFGYPMKGRTFAMIGVLVTTLSALFSSPVMLIPEGFGLALTFAYALFGFPTTLLTRFGSWRLQRDLSKRASHLKVVGGGKRNIGGDSDKYLH